MHVENICVVKCLKHEHTYSPHLGLGVLFPTGAPDPRDILEGPGRQVL